jgi:hypothetical protein
LLAASARHFARSARCARKWRRKIALIVML